MHSRKGLAERHEGRPESFHDNPATTEDRQRWRRTLAAIAISALAVGGMSALVASPAAADDLTLPGVENVVEEEAKKKAEQEEKAKKAADEAATAAAALQAAEEEKAKKAAEEEKAKKAADEAAAAAAALQAAEEEKAKKAADEAATAAAALQAAEEEKAKKAEVLDAPIVALLEPPDPTVVQEKVEICHSTSSHTNPYVINEPNASGDVQGHADHDGPIWFPGIEEDWGDIIPPFLWDGGFFPGLNWDAEGQAIYANDCKIPDRPDVVLTVTAHACPAHGGTGTVFFAVDNLLSSVDYRVTVLNSGGAFVDAVEISGVSGLFEGSFNLPPGNYTIVLDEVNGSVFEITRQQFTIGACPLPPIVPEKVVEKVVVKQLAATGAETAEPLMAGGMIMLLMGGAALLAANRRRWGTSHSE